MINFKNLLNIIERYIAKKESSEFFILFKKLNRLFENSALNNLEVVNVDVSIEGGLGTVYAGAQALGTVGYDEEENINIGVYADSSGVFKISEGLTTEAGALKHETYRDSYRLVFNEFKDFAEQKRKDHIHHFLSYPQKQQTYQLLNLNPLYLHQFQTYLKIYFLLNL